MNSQRNSKKRLIISIATTMIYVKKTSNILYVNKNDESDSSTSSESENNDDDISVRVKQTLYCIMASTVREKMIATEKLTDYVDRVIPNYSNITFKQHFRMLPATFEIILTLIGPVLNAANTAVGRKQISAEKQLLIALWFMATLDSYRSICVKFGIGKATAFRAVRRVTYALHCIAPRFIQWPDEIVANDIIDQFASNCGFPNTIGAIDGTHIKIRAPPTDAASYINRKGFPSINLQVVCDSRGLFTHCYAGEVGSVHDARVFRNSPVALFIERPQVYFPNNSHIIGDAAYAIHPHVMVPFRDNGHLTNRKKNFNYCLSSTRMVVERAIGQLKIRFRILLDCLPLTDVKKIPEFIIACCVLHNICILQNDVITIGVEHNEEYQAHIPDNNAALGNAKRITIMNALQMKIN